MDVFVMHSLDHLGECIRFRLNYRPHSGVLAKVNGVDTDRLKVRGRWVELQDDVPDGGKVHVLYLTAQPEHRYWTAFMTTRKLRRLLVEDTENPHIVRAKHRVPGCIVRRTFKLFLPSTWRISASRCQQIAYQWAKNTNYWRAFEGEGVFVQTQESF